MLCCQACKRDVVWVIVVMKPKKYPNGWDQHTIKYLMFHM